MRTRICFILTALTVSVGLMQALDTLTVGTLPDRAYEQNNVPAVFRISRGVASAGSLTVSYIISGSATNGADYALSGGTTTSATIPDGSAFVDVRITPVTDGTPELRETVIMSLVDMPGLYLRGSVFVKQMLIADADTVVTWVPLKVDPAEYLDASDEDGDPPPPQGAVRITITPVPASRIDVIFQIVGDATSATPGADYRLDYMQRHAGMTSGGTILYGGGDTAKTKVFVPTGGTDPKTNDTSFQVLDVARFHVGDIIAIGGTIRSPTYAITGINAGTRVLTVSPPIRSDEEVNDTDVVTNAPNTLATTTGSVFGFGLDSTYNSLDLCITPAVDVLPEGGETVGFRLLDSPDYRIVSPNDVSLTIADDDVLVSVVAVRDAVEQPASTGLFRLNLPAGAPRSLDIPYQIDGLATPDVDYQSLSGVVTIGQGSTFADIEVAAIPRAGSQGPRTIQITIVDTEDIVLAGSGGTEGAVATINVRDGSSPTTFGTVTILAPSGSATEGPPIAATNFRILATRLGASNPDLVVPISVSGTALPGSDYETMPATVTIPELVVTETANPGSAFIKVRTRNGRAVELTAGSSVRVSNSGSVVLASTASLGSTDAFLIIVSPLSATIPAGTSLGATEVRLPLTPLADDVVESTEVVTLTLSQVGDSNYILGSSIAASGSIIASGSVTPPSGPTGPKPPSNTGSASASGCGVGGSAFLLLGGLAFLSLRRRRAA